MFTTLIAGMCAFVAETGNDLNGVRTPDVEYPAVAIGTLVRDRCSINMVLASGKSTPYLPNIGMFHSFRVEEIGPASAILRIDEKLMFTIPRTNGF